MGLRGDALREKQPKLRLDGHHVRECAGLESLSRTLARLASTKPLKRVNREVKRSADVIGTFPNHEAITRLFCTLMQEIKDEWAVARRYMSLETIVRVPAVVT